MALDFVDHRADPGAWARALGIPREAVELYLASEVIDQHVDTFIWHRVFGYDLTRRHGAGPFGARLLGQADFPRVREAAIGGAVWVVTTNPLRPARSCHSTSRAAKLPASSMRSAILILSGYPSGDRPARRA